METGKDLYNKTIANKYINWLNKKNHQLTKTQVLQLARIVHWEIKDQFGIELERLDNIIKKKFKEN